MNTMGVIHAAYADLPKDIRNSEVLTSHYANIVNKDDEVKNQDEAVKGMIEWNTYLTDSGVSVPDSAILVLQKITDVCHSSGRTALPGELAEAIISIASSVTRQYARSADILDRLDSIADSFINSLERTEQLNNKMIQALPRKKLTVVRGKGKGQNSGDPVKPQVIASEIERVRKQTGGTLGDTEDHMATTTKDERRKSMTGDDIAEEDNENSTFIPKSPTYSPNDGEVKDEEEPMIIDTNAKVPSVADKVLNVESAQAQEMRDYYREYYGCNRFNLSSVEKQHELVDYYMNYVLKIDAGIVKSLDMKMYQMIFDLIDKEFMYGIIEKISKETVLEADLQEAVQDITEAIRVCVTAYGPYTAEARISDGEWYLSVDTNSSDC